MTPLPVSVLMITLNEERNLPAALESLNGHVEQVFIVDSGSIDKTVDVALEYNAKVVQRRFRNFGEQRNWSINELPVTSPWTFVMAPDERVTQQLVEEMRRSLTVPQEFVGYTVKWRLWFMGKPLHVISDSLRIWQTGKGRYSDSLANEQPIVGGKIGRLRGILEHVDSADLHAWTEKQNRYSSLEAIAKHQSRELAVEPKFWGNYLQRRMFFKKHFLRIPFRYEFLWLYNLFKNRAILDGYEGRAWAHLRCEVMRMRELKGHEIVTNGTLPVVTNTKTGDFDSRVLNSALQQELLPDEI